MTHHHPEHRASLDARFEECELCLDNAEAYALNALGHAERTTIDLHLLWCDGCRRAISEIRRVTNHLPFLAEPEVPSASTKAALVARIATEEAAPAAAPAPIEHPIASNNPWNATPASQKDSAKEPPVGPSIWQRWITPAIIAPLAISLLILSAWTNSLRNEVDSLQAQQQVPITLAQVGSQDNDMQLYALKPACPECDEMKASGQFGGNPDGSVGVVVAWNLDPDERHQVWCENKQGEKFLVSDLDVEQTGSVFQAISFPETLGGYQQIYVARHDGTTDPEAELLVAMNEEIESDAPLNSPPATMTN